MRKSHDEKAAPTQLRPDDRKSLRDLTSDLRSFSDKLERIQQAKDPTREADAHTK